MINQVNRIAKVSLADLLKKLPHDHPLKQGAVLQSEGIDYEIHQIDPSYENPSITLRMGTETRQIKTLDDLVNSELMNASFEGAHPDAGEMRRISQIWRQVWPVAEARNIARNDIASALDQRYFERYLAQVRNSGFMVDLQGQGSVAYATEYLINRIPLDLVSIAEDKMVFSDKSGKERIINRMSELGRISFYKEKGSDALSAETWRQRFVGNYNDIVDFVSGGSSSNYIPLVALGLIAAAVAAALLWQCRPAYAPSGATATSTATIRAATSTPTAIRLTPTPYGAISTSTPFGVPSPTRMPLPALPAVPFVGTPTAGQRSIIQSLEQEILAASVEGLPKEIVVMGYLYDPDFTEKSGISLAGIRRERLGELIDASYGNWELVNYFWETDGPEGLCTINELAGSAVFYSKQTVNVYYSKNEANSCSTIARKSSVMNDAQKFRSIRNYAIELLRSRFANNPQMHIDYLKKIRTH